MDYEHSDIRTRINIKARAGVFLFSFFFYNLQNSTDYYFLLFVCMLRTDYVYAVNSTQLFFVFFSFFYTKYVCYICDVTRCPQPNLLFDI